MIHSRLTAKAQTTIPRPVRQALGLAPGDTLDYVIEDGRVTLTRALSDAEEDMLGVNDFSLFTEWADELDSIYDRR